MERIERLLKKANSLPLQSGVYIMKDKTKKVIYVGKAKKLKNRVTSYFRKNSSHNAKTIMMVSKVDDFDYILTDSEFEALVLECSLIKQYQPKYNILLKDDKGYSYIRLTKEMYPRISEVKQKADDGAEYIGPYTSSWAISSSVREAQSIFKLPDCNKSFPRDFGKTRPCLNYHIGRCMGVCTGKITREEYAETIDQALAFLQGNSKNIVSIMEQKMLEYAEKTEFEKAARLRDRIAAIQKLNDKQKVVAGTYKQEDVFALVRGTGKMCFSVLRFKENRLQESENFIIDDNPDTAEATRELLLRFYAMREDIPPRILLEKEFEDVVLLETYFTDKAGRNVKIIIPQKGEQLRLLEMCRQNAAQHLALYEGKSMKQTTALDELTKLLGLKAPPVWIESYDISHTGGQDNVAGMIVFKNGRPYKKAYKRFAIKGFSGQDDYASMAEVLERRFKHYYEDEEGSTFKRLPDLILLDGGKGQIHAVEPVLKEMRIDVPLFGMVKDSKHKTRAIATTGGEIQINSVRSAFTLVTEIQDEVHRFAISYHHQKHRKNTVATTLISIDGIGKARAKELLKHFGSLKKIREADESEIAKLKGFSPSLAKKVKTGISSL
ncbi:MAG: excinuclease ABC subunit UvrC [Clostridia bacterium]|nr:excinuclease ABC subunit UvrC [Clostridia bacterium]